MNVTKESLYNLIDQCNQTGFEMLVYSFGSGFNMETTDQTQLDFYQSIIEYANSKGIEVGGYDLIALSRTISPQLELKLCTNSNCGASVLCAKQKKGRGGDLFLCKNYGVK